MIRKNYPKDSKRILKIRDIHPEESVMGLSTWLLYCQDSILRILKKRLVTLRSVHLSMGIHRVSMAGLVSFCRLCVCV